MKKTRGFTLIELLVVIAIIGVLSSVVLASLNSARSKGADAAIKSGLANMRAQAEIFYDTNNSYYGTVTAGIAAGATGDTVAECQAAGSVFNTTNGIGAMINSVANNYASTPAAGDLTCALGGNTSGKDSWAVFTKLKNPATGKTGWCVDSSGSSEASTGVTGGAASLATCV